MPRIVKVAAHVSGGHFVRASTRRAPGLRRGTYFYSTDDTGYAKVRSFGREGARGQQAYRVMGSGARKQITVQKSRRQGLGFTTRTYGNLTASSIRRFRAVSMSVSKAARSQGNWASARSTIGAHGMFG